MVEGFEWVCDEGHKTTYRNQFLDVQDENGILLMKISANEEKFMDLDSGDCPVCDDWQW